MMHLPRKFHFRGSGFPDEEAGIAGLLIASTQQGHGYSPQRPRNQSGAIAAKSSVSSAYSLHTHLPPRPASFPSLRPDGISGTFSSGWPARRSAGRSSEAPATRRSTGFDACTDLGSDRASPSGGLLPPRSSGW